MINKIGVILKLLMEDNNERGKVIFMIIVEKKLLCLRVYNSYGLRVNPSNIIKISIISLTSFIGIIIPLMTNTNKILSTN